ncbi:MAG: hypothetical protein JW837_07110 [Sedimentisphaerales bacterium]|nr:hypothetical protein [Sedimentisphaerales bacterium]
MKKNETIKKELDQLGRELLAETTIADEVMRHIHEMPTLPIKPNKHWRTIMKHNISKIAAVITIGAGILALFIILDPGTTNSSMAFADVLENIEHRKTVTFHMTGRFRLSEETEWFNYMDSQVMSYGPIHRVEQSDGKMWIVDEQTGQALNLDTTAHTYERTGAPQDYNIYNQLKKCHNQPGYTIEKLEPQQIDGSLAELFRLYQEDEQASLTILVWVDFETQLPVRIEQTMEISHDIVVPNRIQQTITSDIQFDIELDKSLFSIDVPQDYREAIVDTPHSLTQWMMLRGQTEAHMQRIIDACSEYITQNHGQWPDKLEQLLDYGLDSKALINPRRPHLNPGFVYRKPSGTIPRVYLYEAYDKWERGILIGYDNGKRVTIEDVVEPTDYRLKLIPLEK